MWLCHAIFLPLLLRPLACLASSLSLALAQERPFRFWEEARRKELKKREELEREIEHLKQKMLHSVEKHAVADARIKRVEMEAWRSVQVLFLFPFLFFFFLSSFFRLSFFLSRKLSAQCNAREQSRSRVRCHML